MAVQSTALLIADIVGYTRFLTMHRVSLAHAQDVVGRLLEAIVEAAAPTLRLAKLEGDAAFLYRPLAGGADDRRALYASATAIYHAFHARAADLRRNTLCPCEGCVQAGNLRLKLVGHVGEVAVQKVARQTELAGLPVITVHRMLKNQVPVPEYLLMTRAMYETLDADVAATAAGTDLVLDDLGPAEAWYLDLSRDAGGAPMPARLSWMARVGRHLQLTWRSLPYFTGRQQACTGFRNLGDGAP